MSEEVVKKRSLDDVPVFDPANHITTSTEEKEEEYEEYDDDDDDF